MAKDGLNIAPYVAEFLGTFVLVFTIGSSQLSGSGGNPVFAVTAIACALMVMIYSLGRVSGGHFNPAVTFAVALTGKLRVDPDNTEDEANGINAVLAVPRHFLRDEVTTAQISAKVFFYVCSQLAGAILGAFCYSTLFAEQLALKPAPGKAWWQAGVCEVLYTAMLCFVVLNSTAAKKNTPNQFYGLAIGFVIIAGGYAAGPISGGCFNPAAAIAIDITSNSSDGTKWCLPYCGFQLLGGFLASLLFRIVRPEEFMRTPTLSNQVPEQFVAKRKLATRVASEYLGTFVLVLTFGLNVLAGSGATAWSVAAALMCMIYALGDVSGAHFNPAVTIGVALVDKANWGAGEVIAYTFAQVLAGINAGLLFAGLYDGETVAVGPKASFTLEAANTVEFVFTFVIVLVALSTTITKGISTHLPRNFYFALAIGSCVTAGGVAAGRISGGLLNPAVSFGTTVVREIQMPGVTVNGVYNTFSFAAIQLLAGLVGGIIFLVTHEKQRVAEKTEDSPREQPFGAAFAN